MKIGYLMQAGPPRMMEHPFSGPSVHVREVCSELRNLGHQVRIVALFGRRIFFSDDFETFQPMEPRGAIERLLSRFVQYTPISSFYFAAACRRLLRDRDLLYERMGWLGFGGTIASAILRLPLILEVNGDHAWERGFYGKSPKGPALALYTIATRTAIRQARHVIASGTGWRGRVIERFNLNPASVSVVQNGTSLVSLLGREQLRSFQQETDRRIVRIAYIGGFYPWHGMMLQLRAIRRLVDRHLPIEFILIGSGRGEGTAREIVCQLGLSGHAHFLGAMAPQQYAAKLADCDIGVAAYCGTVEFSGLKLMDYKAAGLAVVTTGQGGQPEVIEDQVTGLVVRPCNEDALFDALVRLVSNTCLRRVMGQQARFDAEQKQSWSRTAVAIDAIIRAVVSAASADSAADHAHSTR